MENNEQQSYETSEGQDQTMTAKTIEQPSELKTGADLIADERIRQMSEEGYDVANDQAYGNKQLALAAGCYLAQSIIKIGGPAPVPMVRFERWNDLYGWVDAWPWSDDVDTDKRLKHDEKRSLVIAGALIAAQLDRMLLEEQAIHDGEE